MLTAGRRAAVLPVRPVERPDTAAPATASASDGARRTLPAWVVPLATWLVSAALMGFYLRRGWVAHDEGTLIQAAVRVLEGELPHRDFVDMYTGLLALVDAAGFRLFGVSLLVPRMILLAVALAWVPVVYATMRRFHRPAVAGAVTVAAVVWSVPNYTAAMPSWFNLFFATFGVAALLRFMDTRRTRWLVAAGACAGISVLIKVVGLYFLAAGVLALLYMEQNDPAAESGEGEVRAGGSAGWRVVLALGLGAFTLALVMLVRPRMGMAEVVHFVVPGAAVAALIVWNERYAPALPFARRVGRALRLQGPFLLGFALPVALFMVPYALAGSLGALVHGVLVLPFQRLAEAAMRPPPIGSTLRASLPLLALLLVPASRRVRPAIGVLPWALAALAVATVPWSFKTYWWTFISVRAIIPVAVVAGCVWLAASAGRIPPARRTAALALFATAAVCGIIQYPFSAAVYFCYVAPLGVMAAAAAFSLNRSPVRGGGLLALVYLTLFGALWVNRGYIWRMAVTWSPHQETTPLRSDIGGGIRVQPGQATAYERVVRAMRDHAGGSPYTWAGPDTPELYPMAGLKNPTRNLFEHFDDAATFEPVLLRTLEARRVNVVVVNDRPLFSHRLSPATLGALEARYPRAEVVGRFTVRWRP
ncbi:MAG TPA: glycosyltransferase family 39 protein [Longimicrobium sp.]|nr:glycosyltransferase family 39 protein [Longimicrobium sp.]